MTRIAKPAPKRPGEGTASFVSKPLMLKKSEIERQRQSKRQKQAQGEEDEGPKRNRSESSKVKRAERRRLFRQIDKERNFTCFLCRQMGHSVKNCPKAESGTAVDVCYHCGSADHTTKVCPTPSKTFSFATCFVCGGQGHLSSACQKNEKGLYPNGGGCKYCGSTSHLMKDCKPTKNKDVEATVGTIDAHQGGDDDDVFVALRRQQVDKERRDIEPKKPATKQPKKVVVKF
ncbi:hypothetical protein GGI00_002483 [Coemansia sp. RSA 2681]|nr:hypothetical protein GGI00_002483 [Coemansia sp. RSA 2681]KAJ2460956.1 hypothetical protein GGF42_000507 [Coemansia sp. RSA 2424]